MEAKLFNPDGSPVFEIEAKPGRPRNSTKIIEEMVSVEILRLYCKARKIKFCKKVKPANVYKYYRVISDFSLSLLTEAEVAFLDAMVIFQTKKVRDTWSESRRYAASHFQVIPTCDENGEFALHVEYEKAGNQYEFEIFDSTITRALES